MKILRSSRLVLIILATVTFFGCESPESSTTPRVARGDVSVGGHLKIATQKPIETTVPFDINDLINTQFGAQLHCGLLRLDPKTLEVVPGIAESWSVDEEGTSYLFNLRKGAMFHDDECFGGTSREITANDFAYTFSELCKPNGGEAFETTFKGRVKGAEAFRLGESDNLSGVQVLDDYTLRIDLIKPDPSFLFVLAQPSTAVVAQKAYEKFGSELKNGAGPFVWAGEKNGIITLTRNDEYFAQDAFGNKLPYIDTLSVKRVDTKEKQLEVFFNGGLDVVTNLYLDPVRELLEQHVSEFSGKAPKYVLQRENKSAGYEVYTVYHSRVKGFTDNFMNHRDYSSVQVVNGN